MDLQAIQIFVLIVQEHSFVSAARKINIPKQTISRKLSRLEKTLGVRLIERSTRKLRLTEAGKKFYSYALQITQLAQTAEEDMLQQKAEPQGHLKITSPNIFGELFLRNVLIEYAGLYPKVSLEITFTSQQLSPLDNDIDVAFWLGPLPETSMIAKKIASSPTGCFVSPSFIHKHSLPQKPQDLISLPALQYQLYRQSEWLFQKNTKNHRFQPSATLKSNSFWVLRDAVLQGLGYARLPIMLCSQELQNGSLYHILPEWSLPPVTIFAIYPSRKQLSSTIRAFLNLVDQHKNKLLLRLPKTKNGPIISPTIRLHKPDVIVNNKE